MSSADKDQISCDNENTCVVCFKNVDIYSVGVCDHPVCYECSTRMRVLCLQNECPICRGEMPKVIFVKEVDLYNNLITRVERTNLQDRKFGLLFMSGFVQRAYHQLLEHNCHLCMNKSRWPFRNFNQLKDHMRKEHQLFYCELCVANLKIFTFERRCYTRSELALHKRKGDVDNKSHRGHPLCEFCDTRYMDSDELFRHLRRDHLYCHFCDADGKHQYYNSYNDLRAHFLEEHYLCDEGDCKNEQFTSVFRTDIDFRAHVANVHSRHLSKSATKQARTLELEFTLAPRPREQNSRGRRYQRNERDEIEDEGAVGYESFNVEPGGNRTQKDNKIFINAMNSDEFPSLGSNGDKNIQAMNTPSVVFTSKSKPNQFSGEDFPSLGSNLGPQRSSNVTITTHSKVAQRGLTSNKTPEVTITRTVQRGSQNLKIDSQNFPALGASSGSNSTIRLSVSNSQDRTQSARPNFSIHVSNQANVSIATTVSTPSTTNVQVRPKTSEAFPALGSTSPPETAEWVPQKTKKTQEPKTSKVNPAPVLPSSDLNDFPILPRSVKKKSSVTMPVTNSWVNLNNFNNEARSLSTTAIKEEVTETNTKVPKVKQDKKENKASKNSKKSDVKLTDKGKELKCESKHEKHLDEKVNGKDTKWNEKDNMTDDDKTKIKKKKLKNNLSSENKPSASVENANESGKKCAANENHSNILKNGIVKKVSELKIENINNDADEFPVLGSRKPPPGFNFKPPPGFDHVNVNLNQNNVLLPNGLTFTNSSGQSYSITPTPSYDYHVPPNFDYRNKKLVEKFKSVFKDNDSIVEFKNYSSLFREGLYPATNYYELCKQFLGNQFHNIFPELLVLLPDILKQQELYNIYILTEDKKDLEMCYTCNQVMFVRDIKSHLSNHTLENNFPVVGSYNEPCSSYWRQ